MTLIVALDFEHQTPALHIVEQLDPKVCALKVGYEMFTLFGPDFVRALVNRQFKVFLDLKFHDIPNTVARACQACADLGIWMLNVHAIGGEKMLLAAREALERYGQDRPTLIAVTVLTSLDEPTLKSVGISQTLSQQVCQLAQLTKDTGLDGVVCGASNVPMIKQICGQTFLTVTPGIRRSNDPIEDQVSVMTPQMALQAGSDYLVVGRPITRADNPAKALQEILQELRAEI